ncbi:MAG TPA: SDR family NAD(P)-dependent oxidoreductase [Candidatus Thermoplasmatota archaeon]|nr:SDR family NAD(P)-dependent oxidoreductase [Candidatus Thermoplasmatota archaeon]
MSQAESVAKEPVAIIGLGCVLPDAPDVKAFWDNVLAGKSSIREVPKGRWDPALYYSTDKSQPDTTYTKIGGFVLNDNFSGLDYRMPPSTVAQIDPVQRWALSASRQAFKDAGYKTGLRGDEGREFNRNKCAIILGNAMGGELQKETSRRVYWPEAAAAIRANPEFQTLPKAQQDAILNGAEAQFKHGLIPITEDTMPGALSNVVAGRIANVFDLSGKNFTTDAACASSFAAMDAAVHTLQGKESDLVLWGGSDRSMDVSSYIQFSKIGALSPDGSRPFDAGANGFVMGEGCAMFLLKRLSDAERDGDRVYAVIRGIGASSDGKGKGITAPNPAGQVKAVLRAYEDAGIDPATIGLLEAHGTSTPVGDPVELQSVMEAYADLTKSPIKPGTVAVGSVKGNIGHLKAAAGAAGVLKATLALKNGVLPPSINVKQLNPRIDWARAPFKVQTKAEPWQPVRDHPRRAAVSSFGFGGTNFHIVLEEHVPGRLVVANAGTREAAAQATTTPQISQMTQMQASARSAPSAVPSASVVDVAAFAAAAKDLAPLEAEALVLDGATAGQAAAEIAGAKTDFPQTGQGKRVRDVLHGHTAKGLAAQTRVAVSLSDPAELPKKLSQAQKAATDPNQARLAFQQGVFLNQGKPQGKVAFLFPGQGTQYVNMLRDLAGKYEVIRSTFHEADEILMSELDGVRLTDILWPTPNTPEAQAASEKKLQLTEFTQPAVLAADVALLRLLRQWGLTPDVVAGHSLGEYGALVAAEVLTFADALHAVAARGREMAHVEVPDLGKMASVSGDWHAVTEHLKGLTEYVIPANKNCPSQTVIAGSSKGVDQAVALLQSKGLQAQYLPVSAAFHSSIVAPASKPLRKVLARLGVKAPKVRVLSNVGTQPYQDDVEWILDNLATQVASPVEWIGIVERMYEEGVRTFIEIGPKLALTNFVRDILKAQPDAVAIGSNHPKKGGVVHVNELFAFLGAWGFRPKLPELDDPAVYTAEFRDPAARFRTTKPQMTQIRQNQSVSSSSAQSAVPSGGRDARLAALQQMADELRRLVEQERTAPGAPAVQAVASGDVEAEVQRRIEAFGFSVDDIGVSGISVGLPGQKKPLFADDNWDRILRGENLIDNLSAGDRQKMVDKNIVRLSKGGDGSAQFQVVSDIAQVIHLAGRRGGFDIAQYGVGKELAESLDITFQYAIAAGLEALRDAGIPLVRTYLQTSQGGHLPKEWKLPEPMRDETGIVFASAFPGYDNLLRDVSRYLADKSAGRSRDELNNLYNELIGLVQDDKARDKLQTAFDIEFTRLEGTGVESTTARYEFNRKFLFNVLSMGHSQLAQLIGARGPNTQVNAACASTTQGIAIAEDWIRTGRCKRVLVVGADDVTSDAMFEWIGAGFLASGAATTQSDVTKAALPFDKRRHGMIVGMGAVGLVLESTPECTKRGMRPIARLLATRVSNSAFHGSRLDVSHIAAEMQSMLASAGRKYGITPEGIAAQTVFMSHETYTPARGGSASAEIAALRATFGANANKVVVANTKGFTGHPQGAGVEDAIVLKCLQRGQLPPIANFKEPDPELGDLNLSKGGRYDIKYALRLAAGFGSQVAMTLTELVAKEAERVADPQRYQAWLSEVSGLANAKMEVQNRTLRIVDQGPPQRKPKVETKTVAPLPPTPQPQMTQILQTAVPASTPSAKPAVPSAGADDVLPKLIDLVAQKTGYPKDLLDPDLDMEADLGIDTVKQAELFGAIRDLYGLPQEQNIQIKDYPSLRKVAGYVTARLEGPATHPAPPPAPATEAAREVAAHSPKPESYTSEGLPVTPSHSLDSPKVASMAPAGDVLARLIELVSQKTGYPTDLLDPNLDMEADLGIDTVKQAELFGAIREAYSLPAEEGIQIKDYPSLAKVAGYVQSRLGGAASTPKPQMTQNPQTPAVASAPSAKSAVPSVPKPAPPATTGALDESAVLQKVIQLVAAKTGYPADMLEPDLDMEADLGIDTVKQAELFGEVRTAYGIPMLEGLLIKDYPTLRKVAGFVLKFAPTTTTQHAERAETTETGSAGSASSALETGIVRRVPTLRPQPSPKQENKVPRGPVLVLGDVDDAWTTALSNAGFQPTTGTNGQPPVGLVALALRPGSKPTDRVGPVFDAAKAHRASLANGFVLVVTRQDGAHGLKSVRDPSMAALAGLGKALRKEFPQATTKVIDLHTETPHAIEAALRELTQGGPRTEVCFGHDGARLVVEVSPQELPDGVAEVAGKGLVVSGGAQGITVELLAALAPQKPKLLLLGRTEVPAAAEQWAGLDAAGWKAKEAELVEGMKSRGERVTPVSIQKALSPLQKAAEVHRNLHRLTDLGAEVLYAPVDVTNKAAVNDAVAWARDTFGRIDGVLHAAGMEISKDIASKDRAQFDLVFGIKSDGWTALMEATSQDKLEFVAAFGSVAGRFGNIGQTDYSAANEFLCKAVKHEAARRKCNGFTIAWGPWGEVGMATKGSILQIMHASGVTPIPTADGVAAFLNELAIPGIRESVVAGELGAIDADKQVVSSGWDVAIAVANELVAKHPERFRLLDSIDSCTPEKRLEATLTVDAARDRGLADHKVEGIPYLPGVFGIEAFAEAASLLAPQDARFAGADNVRFASPLKQLKAQPVKAKVTCEVLPSDGKDTKVACQLTTQFVGPDGKAHGEPRLHFEATVRFGGTKPAPHATGPAPTGDLPRSRIYPPFFHGPSFQVLQSAGPLTADSGVALYREPAEAHFGAGPAQFASNPMLAEALFQVCGLRTMVAEHAMALPAGIERLDVFHAGPAAQDVRLVGHAMGRTPEGLRRFDAHAVTKDGTVLMRMTGYTMVETGPAPAMPTLSAISSPAIPGAEVPLPTLEDAHFAAVPVVAGAQAEPSWFTGPERAQHASYKVPKRADEWRAGRLAAKKAVVETHPGVGPLDVEIIADGETGRPRLVIQGQESALWLSISHRSGLAIAGLSPGAIGVDLETVEDRERSFLEEAFNVGELKTMLDATDSGADPRLFAACMWAAKEAALKRAGVGLKADLRAHHVLPDGVGGATVSGPTGTVGVRFFDAAGLVLAVSAPQLDPMRVGAKH